MAPFSSHSLERWTFSTLEEIGICFSKNRYSQFSLRYLSSAAALMNNPLLSLSKPINSPTRLCKNLQEEASPGQTGDILGIRINNDNNIFSDALNDSKYTRKLVTFVYDDI